MLQSEINRRVANATGESRQTIARLGFVLSDPSEPIEDPHDESLGPWILDWDDSPYCQDDPDAQTALDLLFA